MMAALADFGITAVAVVIFIGAYSWGMHDGIKLAKQAFKRVLDAEIKKYLQK